MYLWLEGVEELVSDVYFRFQQKFSQNPRQARFWIEAALEELHHASMLRFCRERRLFSHMKINGTDIERVTATHEIVTSLASAPDLTIDLALFAGLQVQSSGLYRIFIQLIHALAANHTTLFTALETSLRGRHEAFADAVLAFLGDQRLARSFRSLSDSVTNPAP